MVNTARITELTFKYVTRQITTAEMAELDAYLDSGPGIRERFEGRIKEENSLEAISIWGDVKKTRAQSRAFFGRTNDHTTESPVHRINRTWVWVAAASVLLLVAVGGLMNSHRHTVTPASTARIPISQDVAPGGNRAVLTLDNGRMIVLDSAANGLLAEEGGSKVQKTADGRVTYAREGGAGAMRFNTLTTPAGGQYRLVLSDGTRVWLNNASSLRFPTAFTGARREVELTGEGYFEVAKNLASPFLVKERSLTVQVLGTRFNIKAYSDEALESIALLEGAVKVVKGDQKALLAPGDLAAFPAKGAVTLAHGVDVDEIVSWKNGYFHFSGEDLPGVMTQLARWYDVSVEYRGRVKAQKFKGKIERNLPLSTVLQGLESSEVHFSIEGNKIVVRP